MLLAIDFILCVGKRDLLLLQCGKYLGGLFTVKLGGKLFKNITRNGLLLIIDRSWKWRTNQNTIIECGARYYSKNISQRLMVQNMVFRWSKNVSVNVVF